MILYIIGGALWFSVTMLMLVCINMPGGTDSWRQKDRKRVAAILWPVFIPYTIAFYAPWFVFAWLPKAIADKLGEDKKAKLPRAMVSKFDQPMGRLHRKGQHR